jgi:hypothetical protein
MVHIQSLCSCSLAFLPQWVNWYFLRIFNDLLGNGPTAAALKDVQHH